MNIKYRKEVDGLRALAVMPVILFHSGIGNISGGYVGVDVFFVISGYLITTIILSEMSDGQFSIVDFYERRARRILPALSVVMLVTTVLAYLFMNPAQYKSFSQSLVSVSTFLSNVFFYLSSGYFSTASDEKPLLHTWSLAVEEQYYLFFPIMIIAFWSFGKKWLLLLIITLLCMSLATADVISKEYVDANFYLIPTRAWELFMGSIIAFIPREKFQSRSVYNELIAVIGLMMIFYSMLYFDRSTPFPSLYTIVPVLGTFLVILFAKSWTIVGRVLSFRPFVFIGLISYSLYLWHQPVFAFVRIKTDTHFSSSLFVIAIILIFVLSFLSWKYIEKPFRNKKKYSRSQVFLFSAISILGFSFLGLVGHFSEGLPSRFNVVTYEETIKPSPKRNECHTKGANYLSPKDACIYHSADVTWAAFGDSHALEPAYALANRLRENDTGLLHLTFSGCPPALNFESKQAGCTAWITESVSYIEESESIKNVLLGFRHSAYLFGDQLAEFPNIPNLDASRIFSDEFRETSKAGGEAREIYWESFREIIYRLMASGKRIYLLYPIPELPMNISKVVYPFSIFGSVTPESTTTFDYYLERNTFILNKLDGLSYGERLVAIRPQESICSRMHCSAVVSGKALYFDDDHLSVSGAELIMKNVYLK